jgi:hypothetical protein
VILSYTQVIANTPKSEREIRILKLIMKKIFLIVSILFLLSSFTENSPKGLNYAFKKGNRIMKLEFDTNNKYLELNKITTLKISFENISVNSFSIHGVGIQISGGGKNFTK